MNTITLDQAFNIALAHHHAGRLAEAQAIYKQILAQQPAHPDSLHLLGLIAGHNGHLEEANALIRRAMALAPNQALYPSNLGQLYQKMNRPDQAAELLQLAIRINPQFVEAHYNLGVTYEALGRRDAAIACYNQCLRLQPHSTNASNNLGNQLRAAGRIAEAVQTFENALRIDPNMFEIHGNLGAIKESLGRYAEAIEHYHRALAVAPGHYMLHYNMGVSLAGLGRNAEAAASYRQAIQLQPDYAPAYNNLGNILKLLGRFDEAITAFQQALRLNPTLAEAYGNLSSILESRAEHAAALAAIRRAVELRPDNSLTHSNLVYTMLFLPEFDAPRLKEELALWNQCHATPLRGMRRPHTNDRNPQRRLRIGYISPDFRDHVIGRNMLPVMREHDRTACEIFCYSNLTLEGEFTARFRKLADHWRPIWGLPDEQVAQQIRADGIDILVELALHLAGNRLPLMAYKPAPVLVTFAGYPGSTGVETIDYRLTDPYLDPPAQDACYSERSMRLPATFWCYDPLGITVEPNALPAPTVGHVTFGCLNHFCKVNDGVLELWCQVLRAVPRSHLMLLTAEGSHRQRTRDFCQARGVTPERLEFVTFRPRTQYLELYHRIDIGLDTLPYNGHTTSLDALWMGVPVVTLVGRTVVGRAGYSQLTNLNLPELITWDQASYVKVVTTLAGDLPRLAQYRATLRQRMENSPLMDAPAFTRGIEAAYRQMWHTWCGQQPIET